MNHKQPDLEIWEGNDAVTEANNFPTFSFWEKVEANNYGYYLLAGLTTSHCSNQYFHWRLFMIICTFALDLFRRRFSDGQKF